MAPLEPLIALLGQAERERDEAQAHLLKLREAERAAVQQCERLRQYRSEYDGRFGARAGAGRGIELLRCAQGFAERLSHAVEQQERVAEHAARQVAAAEAQWREAELRVASVRKLIENRVAEIRRGEPPPETRVSVANP